MSELHPLPLDGGTRTPLSVGSLFAGIAGIDLGLERTGGFKTAWFSEIDPFASAVLRKHWPDVPNLGDVRDLGAGTPGVDVLAGGFPCQPVSVAGARLAQDDPRWLWPHVARLVGDLRPRYVLLENVPGLRSKGLGDVLEDLSALGYDAEWDSIPASAVSAPHVRERVWIVAYPNSPRSGTFAGSAHADEGANGTQHDHLSRRDGEGDSTGKVSDAVADPRIFHAPSSWPAGWATEPRVARLANGIPRGMDRARAFGNAVVPQVAELVGRMILADALRAE